MKCQIIALQGGGLRLSTKGAVPRLQRAFCKSVGAGMLDLLYHGLPPQADAALAYLHDCVRQAAMAYLRDLRQAKQASFCVSRERARELLLAMPPIQGASLSSSHIEAWFGSLDAALLDCAALASQSPERWLASLSPSWQQIGMICLHLAENGGEDAAQSPFAFLATFVHQLGSDDKARHMPLGLAARVYEQDPQALRALLLPLQRVAAQSPFLAELISSGQIYQPCAWGARQCYDYLCTVPSLQQQGVETRMVKLWKSMPPRVELEVKLDSPPAASSASNKGLQLHSLLHFSLRTVLAGMQLSDEDLEQLMQSEDGLIRFKGEWVRLDAAQLQQIMSHWRAATRMAAGGIPLLVGLRYLLGKRREALPQLPSIKEEDPIRLVCGQELQCALEQLQSGLAGAAADSLLLPPPLAATLRRYQYEGALFLHHVTQTGFGACLADDMGLGKSIQVIAFLCHLAAQGHLAQGAALIIAPASLLDNWQEEIRRFAPHLRCQILHPQRLDKRGLELLDRDPSKLLAKADVALTSYGMASRSKNLAAVEHPALILDEAQAIKNHDSQRTRAILGYCSPRRVALSGTPIENKLQELHSLFNFLTPGLLGSSKQFEAQLREMGHDYSPLKQLLRPFLLRRHKSDPNIAPDLPAKIQQEHYCQLSTEQAQLYAREIERMQAIINEPDPQTRMALLLPLLGNLKQICNHPAQYLGEPHYESARSGKMQQLEALTRKLAAAGEPCLIFTQYRSMMEAIHQQTAQHYGQSGLILHGGTPIAQRQQMVQQFQDEEGPPFMLLSLKAAGTGLTLTRARHVIHFDRWWNPAVEAQASDRVHRIGQKRSVFIHALICKGSIEENIHRMLAEKQKLADGILAEGLGQLMKNMSAEDLLSLVQLRA